MCASLDNILVCETQIRDCIIISIFHLFSKYSFFAFVEA